MSNEEIEKKLKRMDVAESEKLFKLIDEVCPDFKIDTELTQADIDRIFPRQAD